MSREEVASPMIMLESIFTTAAIKASEGGDVAIIDLTGAFLHAESDKGVIMIMKRRIAELMVSIALQLH